MEKQGDIGRFKKGNDSVSYPQCSGQLGGGSLILHGLFSVPKLLGIGATGSKILV